MRNLKKFLALALAMVMAFSLMLTASAASNGKDDFNDSDKVSDEFVESVAILSGLNVIKGDGDGDKKDFRPQDKITRAEAAALVYRVATGDIDDAQVKLYSDYGKFSDVNSEDWFAGYVGYCQNAGIIKGTTPTTFSPYREVTGYEVLAMILRAVGYGKDNEFTGSQWQVNVASLGKTKHITDSVTSTAYGYTLNQPARREIVAELLFRGSMIPQVTWTAIGGYNERTTLLGNAGWNQSLAQEVFGLNRAGWRYGSWGRPELVWTATLHPTSNSPRTVATLQAKASHTFTDLRRECDVAELLEVTTDADYTLFVNAAKASPVAVTNAYKIKATDTVTKVGGYGRLTEIYLQEDMDKQYPYFDYWTYWSTTDGSDPTQTGFYRTALADTFVMIDTYLAEVTATTPAVLDGAGHLITPARMTVNLYDGEVNDPSQRIIEKSGKDNWEYSAGDVLSMKGVSSSVTTDAPRVGGSLDESWAFTLPKVRIGSTTNGTRVLKESTDVFDITALSGVQGKQTTVYWNNGKHQVNGEDKTDDLALRMDKAGSNIDTTFTWYYDAYGYLLGIGDGGRSNYGVITSIYVSYGANESTDGVAKAVATVKYADGTTGTETVDYFLAHERTGAITAKMTETNGVADDANVVQLWPFYNVASEYPMHEYATSSAYGAINPSPKRVTTPGSVYMAPVAANNAQSAAVGVANSNDLNVFGILNNNLWKFVKSAGDKTVAIEVAGGDATYTAGTPSANTNSYAGHWAATNQNTAGTNNSAKVYKTLSYVDNGGAAPTTLTWLDNDTQIMVRNPNGGIVCYDGVSSLPGDITIADADTNNKRFGEIDWADTDNDGRADVLYVTGSVKGVTTYGLFYTNSLTSTWNGTTGTIHGFWNGEETDLTFVSLEQFNLVKNAYNNNADEYKGHLFAIKQSNGVVEAVLTRNSNGRVELLYDTVTIPNANTSGTSFSIIQGNFSGNDWQYGVGAGATTDSIGTNPYSASTQAVYWTDNATTPVVYNASSNWQLLGATVTVGGNTYRLTPNSKVYGIGSNVVLAEGVTALEYLNHSVVNDVTIVHENNSVIEMYIQTDPNITPSNPNLVYSAAQSYDSVNSRNTVTVSRNVAVSVATNFSWKVYTCNIDKSNPVAVAANFGTGSVAANNLNSGAIAIENVGTLPLLTSGRYYFVRVTIGTSTYDTEVFFK